METTEFLSIKKWTLYNSAGWFLGVLLIVLLSSVFEGVEIAGQAGVGIGMGAGMGIMQWLALRKYSGFDKKWIWFLMIGFSVPFILFDILSIFFDLKPETYLPVATTLGGLLTGWLQYRFVLKEISEKSRGWIFYCCMGWLIACGVTMGFFGLSPNLDMDKRILIVLSFVFVLIGGPLLGLITGRSIISILKKN